MASIQLSHFSLTDPRVARLRKRRGRQLRAIRPSQAVRLWYRAQLGEIVDHLRAAGAEVAKALRPRTGVSGDAAMVADETSVEREMRRAEARFGGVEITARRLTNVADRLSLVRRGLAAVDDRLIDTIRKSIGVDVSPFFDLHGDIGPALRDAAAANVTLIKSLPVEYFAEIRQQVTDGVASGLRWEDIADRIKVAGDHAQSRVKVIARDQVSKMNAAFNEVRQQQVGIEEYIWSGALDVRERASHRAMEGTIQRWDSPPEIDGEHVHPGEAILCRCGAIPHFHLDAAPAAETEAA